MAPITEQICQDSGGYVDPAATQEFLVDVPGLMADRVGRLWAEAEYASRVERVERVIRDAEAEE